MAPQIAHKHHRGHGKLALGLWGSCYQDIPFVYHSFTNTIQVLYKSINSLLKFRNDPGGRQ